MFPRGPKTPQESENKAKIKFWGGFGAVFGRILGGFRGILEGFEVDFSEILKGIHRNHQKDHEAAGKTKKTI